MKSKLISISAVSAGFIAISLLLGAYFEFADVFSMIIASVFVTLPLYYRSYRASLLTYLAGGVIAFLCSGFNLLSLVFPAYFALFGIYPIVKFFLEEKGYKYAGFVLGLIWCALSFLGLYYYYTFVMGRVTEGFPQWVMNNIELITVAISVVFFFVYNKFLSLTRRISNYYINKIIK